MRLAAGSAAWIGRILLALAVTAATFWASFALYFGDSATSGFRTVLATLFAVAGLAAVVAVFVPRRRVQVLRGFSLLFAAVLAWWFSIAPSNDREWQPDVAQLPYVTIDGERVTVHNVRNFTYRTETDYTPAYYTRTYDLAKLDSVDLYSVYWMGPAIAHTSLGFGCGGRDYLAVSIEARKELGEGYFSIKGFFRQYELIYIVADERDVVRLRTNFRKDPPEEVYRHRVPGPPENARRLFLEYIKNINAIKEHPRFYNTLTANCTDVIWMRAHVNPGRIPFSWKILASGYAPQYLYESGRLDTSVSFEELRRRGCVNPVARAIGDVPDFSRRIRVPVPSQGSTVASGSG